MDNEFLLMDRLQKIRQIIGKYGEENFYISFSGGKDSTVLSALIDMALSDNKIPRVYANTGIELNMIRDFVFDMAKTDNRVVIIKPSVPIKPMLERDGYPFKSKEHSHIVDIYNRNGMDCITVPRYLDEREGYGTRYRCPKILRYQFTDEFKEHLKISDKCCLRMKEEPLGKWAKENNKSCRILGIMPSEGGRRTTTKCLAFKNNGKFLSFHPLAPVTKEWENWFIEAYDVKICDIYKEPYNFERTGCKGCPFALHLQDELDTLEKYFPNERKQCEAIWAPIYKEYRRLGYRLKEESRMEELTTTKTQELTNKELKDYTRKIKKCGDNIRSNFMKIAHNLNEIDETECYLDDGFEDVQDYASKVLGIQKTTCYNLIKIAKEFLNTDGTHTVLTTEGNDYGVSQLQALLPVGVEKAKELHDNETISPDMSVRQIKAIIKEETTEPEPEPEDDTIDTEGETVSEEIIKPLGTIEIMENGDIIYTGDIDDLHELIDDIITNYISNR